MELTSLFIFIPLLLVPFLLLFPKHGKKIVFSGILLQGIVLGRIFTSMTGQKEWNKEFSFTSITHWFSFADYEIYYAIRWDYISFLLVFLTLIIMATAVVATPRNIEKPRFYYVLLMFLLSSLLGSFLADDYFLFYVFFEFMLIPMYFLIGKWGGKERVYATFKFFIYTFLGSLLILGGIFMLLTHYETLRYEELIVSSRSFGSWDLKTLAFFLLFIGFAIKLPLFPLHNWLPTAHVEASTPISMLLAGVLLKVGGYGLLRWVYPFFGEIVGDYRLLLDIWAIVSVLWGGLLAFAQEDLKRMVAYSSVAHMGLVVLGLNAMNSIGSMGALLQMFFHGFISAGLFFLVGTIYSRTGSREIQPLSSRQKTPGLFLFTLLFFFAGAGFPPFGLFVAEFGILSGAYLGGVSLDVLVGALLGIFFSVLYFIRALSLMYVGENSRVENISDLNRKEKIVLGFLFFFVLLGGIFPKLFLF